MTSARFVGAVNGDFDQGVEFVGGEPPKRMGRASRCDERPGAVFFEAFVVDGRSPLVYKRVKAEWQKDWLAKPV